VKRPIYDVILYTALILMMMLAAWLVGVGIEKAQAELEGKYREQYETVNQVGRGW